MRVIRILGVDPGSRLTGYGCVDLVGNQLKHVTHGTLRIANTGGKATVPLDQRLLLIHEGLSQVIQEYKPQVMAVEKVFFAKNAVSALKLGQARGAVVLSGAIHGLDIVEYSPTEVKAMIVGYGRADKDQVAKMLQMIVGAQDFVTSDASDGLALAVCHAQMLASLSNRPSSLANALRSAGRQTTGKSTRGKKRNYSMAECVGISAEMLQRKK